MRSNKKIAGGCFYGHVARPRATAAINRFGDRVAWLAVVPGRAEKAGGDKLRFPHRLPPPSLERPRLEKREPCGGRLEPGESRVKNAERKFDEKSRESLLCESCKARTSCCLPGKRKHVVLPHRQDKRRGARPPGTSALSAFQQLFSLVGFHPRAERRYRRCLRL